jgi:hypothetical protein
MIMFKCFYYDFKFFNIAIFNFHSFFHDPSKYVGIHRNYCINLPSNTGLKRILMFIQQEYWWDVQQ